MTRGTKRERAERAERRRSDALRASLAELATGLADLQAEIARLPEGSLASVQAAGGGDRA